MRPNAPLAPFTSLSVGGLAERLYTYSSNEQLQKALDEIGEQALWVLGYGANVLISDAGLSGATLLVRSGTIVRESTTVIADAGVWWDDLVQFAIQENLWGLELMSAIPGGVGAAIVGNIAAYGQAVADTLSWVEVFDRQRGTIRRMRPDELSFGYRTSAFQTKALKKVVILRAAFTLQTHPTKELEYQTALDIARQNAYRLDTLAGRRQTILTTREGAGSLWDYRGASGQIHTAGSFFRNPLVSSEVAERLMAFDETGQTAENLRKMNRVHGGADKRVSAAHVLLAAGFQRGQTWGPIRLHPDHILKIENTGGATAQQIYDVARHIIRTVKDKLDVELVPEVQFLGEFQR